MISVKYRSDYPGEFVILESSWAGGKKKEKREWIPNSIENQHISGRAACIGSSLDKTLFDYTRLQRHRGGLLGSKKMQTYGTGCIAQEMRLDFTIETDNNILSTFVESKYCENNIVYTSARNCILNPGEFYLIPQHPRMLDIALLPYLAAFDKHEEIFLLGYSRETPIQNLNWINHLRAVMDVYDGVKFYLIGESSNMADSWLSAPNSITMNYREFISYCDI